MFYGNIIATGLALVALVWLESVVGEKQRNWEDKYKDYQDEIDRLNDKLKDTINSNNYEMDFKELIDLHYQSFSTADNTKLLLDDARDSLKAIGQTIMKLKENKNEIEIKLKNLTSSQQELKEELTSVIETRKELFNIQDKIKEQRNTLSRKLKEFNQNTQKLKFKIKDNTGSRGREWFKKLERKKEARNNNVNTSNNNGCYLTTACTEYMGLKDDCYELEMLRSFRDTYVKSLSNGDELIMQYYNDAPKILFEISKSKDKDVVFTSIYQTIEEITRYILLEKYEDAYISYQCMYKVLEVNYLGNRKCKIV